MATPDESALGLLETHGLIAAIEGADAMLKAASVRLVAMEQTVAALITVQVVGEVAAVQAAVDAGRLAAARVGKVVSAHVIARPADEVRALQFSAKTSPAPASARPAPSPASLADLTVRELRARAREVPDFPLQGRAIARATKKQLTDLLARLR